jgi:hypothetical protein
MDNAWVVKNAWILSYVCGCTFVKLYAPLCICGSSFISSE